MGLGSGRDDLGSKLEDAASKVFEWWQGIRRREDSSCLLNEAACRDEQVSRLVEGSVSVQAHM